MVLISLHSCAVDLRHCNSHMQIHILTMQLIDSVLLTYLPNEFHGSFSFLFGGSKMVGEEIVWPFAAFGARTEHQN